MRNAETPIAEAMIAHATLRCRICYVYDLCIQLYFRLCE